MTTWIETGCRNRIAADIHIGTTGRLVFLEHGLAGWRHEPVMQAIKEAFIDAGYTVVTFDARFGFGETGGDLEQACFTHFIEDLKSVILWAQGQDFYVEPFALAGHSLGAGAACFYAAEFPDKVNTLICVSAVISGHLLLDSYRQFKPDFVKQWQREKLLYRERADDPSKKGYISYDHILDALKYDVTKGADKIKADVLIVYADKDISSTGFINQHLYDHLTGNKEIHRIEQANHSYTRPMNKEALKDVIYTYLKTRYPLSMNENLTPITHN